MNGANGERVLVCAGVLIFTGETQEHVLFILPKDRDQ